MSDLKLRPGGRDDLDAVLRLWDGAVAWMVARGQEGQWGTEPMSTRPTVVARLGEWLSNWDVTIAELEGEPVGVCVVGVPKPGHVAAIERTETYLQFLLSSRAHAGHGIGARLVEHTVEMARASGAEVLRVDCWAGAPPLVAWYEVQGFVRSDTFDVKGWIGQVFEMPL